MPRGGGAYSEPTEQQILEALLTSVGQASDTSNDQRLHDALDRLMQMLKPNRYSSATHKDAHELQRDVAALTLLRKIKSPSQIKHVLADLHHQINQLRKELLNDDLDVREI